MEPLCPSPIGRDELRKLLGELLRTDSGFDAFCLDFFPEVHKQFGSGMDREGKTNLLLTVVDLNALVARLGAKFPDEFGRLSRELGTAPSNRIARHIENRHARLEQLYQMKESLASRGNSDPGIDHEIRRIRRELRTGPLLNPGEILGERVRLIQIVGSGGFATVWKAYDRQAHKNVAVKVMHPQCAAQPSQLERFLRGARQMRRLHHPNIVRVESEPEEYEGFYFFVMEYAAKGDLRHAIREGHMGGMGALPPLLEIGDALSYAHGWGLTHRDVKPRNVLLGPDGRLLLCDFDLILAADTTGGTKTGALGTFLYAAPEEMEDASRVDCRADIYSLAMTMLFALNRKDLPTRVLQNSGAFLTEYIEASEPVKAVLGRALAWDRNDRHATMAEFCMDLQRALALPDRSGGISAGHSLPAVEIMPAGWSAPHTALPPGMASGSPQRRLLRRGLAAALGGLLLLVGGALLLRMTNASLPSKRPPPVPEAPQCPKAGGSLRQPRLLYVDLPDQAFCAHETEVSVEQYKSCVDARRCEPAESVFWPGITQTEIQDYLPLCNAGKPGRENYPINCIDWHQANEYCKQLGMWLPTRAQWSYMATGSDGRKYPWGDDPPTERHLNACDKLCVDWAKSLGRVVRRHGICKADLISPDGRPSDQLLLGSDGYASTAPVGSYPAGRGPFGLLDMAGNVREWTSDHEKKRFPDGQERRVYFLGGGSYLDVNPEDVAASGNGAYATPETRAEMHGFRCVLPIGQFDKGK